MRRLLTLSSILLLAASCLAQTTLDDLWKKAAERTKSSKPGVGLSNDKITAGLKEALNVSTGKAVASTGKPDGFLKNDAIKILLPDKLQTVGRGLRMFGMGAQMDELEIGMNRAAEQATPQAKKIFLNAVMQMSFDDARQILTGGDTAATDYFQLKTSDDLTTAFAPIVHDAMLKVGVIKRYDDLLQNPAASALARQRFDIDKYVVGKTLDGLFYMLAQEEKNIRTNPAARTTTLLKTVFGR